MNGGAISWKNSQHNAVTSTQTEFNHVAVHKASEHITYLQGTLHGAGNLQFTPTILYGGNNWLIENQGKTTRHIQNTTLNMLKQAQNGTLQFNQCSPDNMVANILMKNLSSTEHHCHVKLMSGSDTHTIPNLPEDCTIPRSQTTTARTSSPKSYTARQKRRFEYAHVSRKLSSAK